MTMYEWIEIMRIMLQTLDALLTSAPGPTGSYRESDTVDGSVTWEHCLTIGGTIYLSDGGYSRIHVYPDEGIIRLFSGSSPDVKARWEYTAVKRLRDGIESMLITGKVHNIL